MTMTETSLALVATYIGVPVLAMPFAFYNLGIGSATALLLGIGAVALLSFRTYLRAKDLSEELTHGKFESMYEIAHALFGRGAIFVVCGALLLRNFGSLIINYKIIGEALSSLMTQWLVKESPHKSQDSLMAQLTSPTAGIILTAIVLTPIYFKRKLAKIKIISYILMAIFVGTLVLLCYEATKLET